eukprot:TRINITY_DN294_c1_g1_i1.p1 TRINITY_DN294_c1_g1~~TRINITY_DN294_c1_g1_i1.p1  ORF type:complete len:86 (+),score=33.56 TRINITY_DN294_c1_g1_i1:16-273(+)
MFGFGEKKYRGPYDPPSIFLRAGQGFALGGIAGSLLGIVLGSLMLIGKGSAFPALSDKLVFVGKQAAVMGCTFGGFVTIGSVIRG